MASDPLILTYRQISSEREGEILHRLSAQYEEETLSRTIVCDCCNQFCGGREEVANRPHAHVQATDVNIRRAEELF
jgi:predicted transcriptional regulator of viral defense system